MICLTYFFFSFQGTFTIELLAIVELCMVILSVLWEHEFFHGKECILHSLALVACLTLRFSVNSAEWIHGWREELFHHPIILSLWSGICQFHWTNSTNKSALFVLRSRKMLEQWGTLTSSSLPSVDALEPGKSQIWYQVDSAPKTYVTMPTVPPTSSLFPLALLHKEDPLSAS